MTDTEKFNKLVDAVILELENQKLAMISGTLVNGWSYRFNNPKARKGRYYSKEKKGSQSHDSVKESK